jgi:hypothetical protein
LTGITISSSITTISTDSFSGATNLTNVTIDPANTVFRAENNCIIRISDNVLVVGLRNGNIPVGVTGIGDRAFRNQTGLTSVTIPTSVTSIGERAFDNTRLVRVVIPEGVPSENPDFHPVIFLQSLVLKH